MNQLPIHLYYTTRYNQHTIRNVALLWLGPLWQFTPGFSVPVLKPTMMLFLSPLSIKINHFHAAVGRKQHPHGIHLSEHLPDLRFGMLLLSPWAINGHEMHFCRISPSLSTKQARLSIKSRITSREAYPLTCTA